MTNFLIVEDQTMEFTIIAQSTNNTIGGIEEKVSFVKLNKHLPINWFGLYVYLDDVKIRACLPCFVGKCNLVLCYNFDIAENRSSLQNQILTHKFEDLILRFHFWLE